jgi:hypothetical protein
MFIVKLNDNIDLSILRQCKITKKYWRGITILKNPFFIVRKKIFYFRLVGWKFVESTSHLFIKCPLCLCGGEFRRVARCR